MSVTDARARLKCSHGQRNNLFSKNFFFLERPSMGLTKNIWFKILTLILTILARVRYGQICNAFGLPDLATSDICIYRPDRRPRVSNH